MAKPQKTKKKERKNILQGVVHIQSTFNNTIVTSTDTQGNSSILTSYKDWNNYCFEEFESSLLKNTFSLYSPYDNLFGTQSLLVSIILIRF